MSLEFTDDYVTMKQDEEAAEDILMAEDSEATEPATPPGLSYQSEDLQMVRPVQKGHGTLLISQSISMLDLPQYQYRDILPIIDVDAPDVFEADDEDDLDEDLAMVDPDMFEDLANLFSRLAIDGSEEMTTDYASLVSAPSDLSMAGSDGLPTQASAEMMMELEGELQLDQELNDLLSLDEEPIVKEADVAVQVIQEPRTTEFFDDACIKASTGVSRKPHHGASRPAQSTEEASSSTATLQSLRTRHQAYDRSARRRHQHRFEVKAEKPRVAVPASSMTVVEVMQVLKAEDAAKQQQKEADEGEADMSESESESEEGDYELCDE